MPTFPRRQPVRAMFVLEYEDGSHSVSQMDVREVWLTVNYADPYARAMYDYRADGGRARLIRPNQPEMVEIRVAVPVDGDPRAHLVQQHFQPGTLPRLPALH